MKFAPSVWSPSTPNTRKGVLLMTVAQATPLAERVSIEDARQELSKFFQIADMADKAPEMFSKFIDAEWHRLMENADYTRFCMESVGHPVGHKEGPGYGVVSWIDLYHERFGTLPAAWFASAEGVVDMAAYESYMDNRSTSGAFKCAPPPCEVSNPPALVRDYDCTPTTADPAGLITAWDCTPTTGDPDYMNTSPDPILPPVPDEAAPAQ